MLRYQHTQQIITSTHNFGGILLDKINNINFTASRRLNKAEEIASLYERTTPVELSVQNEAGLSKLVSNSNLVIRFGTAEIATVIITSILF